MGNDFGLDRKRRTILSVVAVIALGGTLGACTSYAKGEIIEVEQDQGENGAVLELEVVRDAYEGTGAPNSYEADIPDVPANNGCKVGAIYPDCVGQR